MQHRGSGLAGLNNSTCRLLKQGVSLRSRLRGRLRGGLRCRLRGRLRARLCRLNASCRVVLSQQLRVTVKLLSSQRALVQLLVELVKLNRLFCRQSRLRLNVRCRLRCRLRSGLRCRLRGRLRPPGGVLFGNSLSYFAKLIAQPRGVLSRLLVGEAINIILVLLVELLLYIGQLLLLLKLTRDVRQDSLLTTVA